MAETPSADEGTFAAKAGACPVCGRPSDVVLRPFCSKRCADIDLHRWLSGSYRIPAEDEPGDPEDGMPSPQAED